MSAASGFVEVTGRDRAKFFRRPLLKKGLPLRYIRYANVNVEMEGDGLKAGTSPSSEHMKRKKPKLRPKTASAAVQTAFRESEAQTEPCTLWQPREKLSTDGLIGEVPGQPDVMSLQGLTLGRGLPARSEEDLEIVRGLLAQKTELKKFLILSDNAEEEAGKKGADLRQSGVMKALEHMCKIEIGLRERFARWRQTARCQGMRSAVEEFSAESDRDVEEKLARLARKQDIRRNEMERRMSRLNGQKTRAMEEQSRIRLQRLGGRGAQVPAAPELQCSPKIDQGVVLQYRGVPSERDDIKGHKAFVDRMRRLSEVERKISSDFDTAVDRTAERLSLDMREKKRPNTSGVYLPRNRQYQNLLDTVYYEIQAAKTNKSKTGPKESQKGHIGMDILKKSSSMENVTMNTSKHLHEAVAKENEATNLKKRPRLDRQIRQMSSSLSLDEGECDDNSERLESVSTSSANANEIADDAIRHAVEGEVVRRQVASGNLLFDGRIFSATDEEEEDTVTMALAEENTVVMVPRRQLSKRLEHYAVAALCAAVNDLNLET